MKRIFQFSHCTLHLYRKKIILFSVLSIGSSLISLFNTLLSGRFIDFLASPNCVEWKPQLCYYCILFLATIMISFAISFALGRIREKLHTMVSYNINRQMLVHIQQIPFSKTFFLDSSRITQQLQTDSNEIASYCICDVRGSNLHRSVIALDVLYRLGKLVCKAGALDGCNGQVLPSVLGAFGGQLAQHHLRVVYEILVDGKAILGLAQLHPCRFDVRRAVTLLQKDNIADNIRACICLKRIVGGYPSAQQCV